MNSYLDTALTMEQDCEGRLGKGVKITCCTKLPKQFGGKSRGLISVQRRCARNLQTSRQG